MGCLGQNKSVDTKTTNKPNNSINLFQSTDSQSKSWLPKLKTNKEVQFVIKNGQGQNSIKKSNLKNMNKSNKNKNNNMLTVNKELEQVDNDEAKSVRFKKDNNNNKESEKSINFNKEQLAVLDELLNVEEVKSNIIKVTNPDKKKKLESEPFDIDEVESKVIEKKIIMIRINYI